MADYHQIVEQIRMALHAGDSGVNGRLAGLASAYADACSEAAHRLARCHRLLQQGLRSEALQLAEDEPKLLDLLTVLDFPERAEWDDLIQMRGLAVAPRISLEPARLLNEAYAEEDPLQDLLRRHRRLALQRSPLRVRISVLRELARLDPGNPIWSEDLRAFERFRLLQIQDEATEGLSRHDPDWTARLVAEVEQPIWTEPPPPTLVQSLRKLDAQVRGDRARDALGEAAARLDEAVNSGDPIRGRMARREWSKLVAAASVPGNDPILDRARPALDWLDRQDQIDQQNREHAEAIARLVRALDYPGRILPEALERLAHDVQSHGEGLPENLRLHYITRLREAESHRSRRRHLIAATSAAAVLFVGFLIYMAAHAQSRSNAADRAAQAISDLVELGEIEQAAAQVKRLESADPDLLQYPALVEVRHRVEASQSKEADRALAFDRAMREAQSAPITGEPPKALETARSLARIDTEKAQVDDLVKRRAATLAVEADRREKELSPRLDRIATAIDQFEARSKSDGGDPAALSDAMASARQSIAELTPAANSAGDVVRNRLRGLSDRLDAVGARMEGRARRGRLESALTAAVTGAPVFDSARFASAMEEYARAFPDAPRARAFGKTLRDQAVWDALAEWGRRSSGWSPGRLAIPSKEAMVRAEQCRQYLTQFPASPDAARIDAYRAEMEAMSHRSADGALGNLQKLMTDLLVDHLWMVTVRPPASSGPHRYYVFEEPKAGARSLRYLAGYDGQEKTYNVVPDWVEKIELSPQTHISQKFKPILSQDAARIDWESTVLDLLGQVHKQSAMDPVLKVALLRKILELGFEGSEPLRRVLGGLREQIDRAEIDINVPWMDPESREADQVRPRARAFLQKWPDPTDLRREVMARRAETERVLTARPRAIGWLAREPRGWVVRTGESMPRQGSIQIALPSAADKASWKNIGTIKDGQPRLELREDPALAEGRPVFVGEDAVSS